MSALRDWGRQIVSGNEIIRNLLDVVGMGMTGEQRKMRFVCRSNFLRRRAIRRITAVKSSTRFPTGAGGSVFGPAPDAIVAGLNENGFAVGLSVSEASLNEILEYCSRSKFQPDTDAARPVAISPIVEENPGAPEQYIYRLLNPHLECKAINKIAHDPLVVEVARKYLDAEPVLTKVYIWWSYPSLDSNGRPLHTPDYGFHFDIDDYKFLKLFIYLNDVDEDRGPHIIIARTHQKRDLFQKLHRRITDQQARDRYGDRVRVMTGKKGTGFFEDTFCYHKGQNPRKRRLVLQFEYAYANRG